MSMKKAVVVASVVGLMGSLTHSASAQTYDSARDRLAQARARQMEAQNGYNDYNRGSRQRNPNTTVANGQRFTMHYSRTFMQGGQVIGACYNTGQKGDPTREGVIIPLDSDPSFSMVIPRAAFGDLAQIARGSLNSTYSDVEGEQSVNAWGPKSRDYQRGTLGPRQTYIWVAPEQAGYSFYTTDAMLPAPEDVTPNLYQKARAAMSACYG